MLDAEKWWINEVAQPMLKRWQSQRKEELAKNGITDEREQTNILIAEMRRAAETERKLREELKRK